MAVCFSYINDSAYGSGVQQEWRLAELKCLRKLPKDAPDSSMGKLASALKQLKVVQPGNPDAKGVVYVLRFEYVRIPTDITDVWSDFILMLNGLAYHARLARTKKGDKYAQSKDGNEYTPIFIRNARVDKTKFQQKTVGANINSVPLLANAATQGMGPVRSDNPYERTPHTNPYDLTPNTNHYDLTPNSNHYSLTP